MIPDRRQVCEADAVEGGVRCPGCGAFVSFGDVVARGTCGRVDCEARLSLDLVVG
jgi:hypothetical protein